MNTKQVGVLLLSFQGGVLIVNVIAEAKGVFDNLKNQVNMVQNRINYVNRYKIELVFN